MHQYPLSTQLNNSEPLVTDLEQNKISSQNAVINSPPHDYPFNSSNDTEVVTANNSFFHNFLRSLGVDKRRNAVTENNPKELLNELNNNDSYMNLLEQDRFRRALLSNDFTNLANNLANLQRDRADTAPDDCLIRTYLNWSCATTLSVPNTSMIALQDDLNSVSDDQRSSSGSHNEYNDSKIYSVSTDYTSNTVQTTHNPLSKDMNEQCCNLVPIGCSTQEMHGTRLHKSSFDHREKNTSDLQRNRIDSEFAVHDQSNFSTDIQLLANYINSVSEDGRLLTETDGYTTGACYGVEGGCHCNIKTPVFGYDSFMRKISSLDKI